MKRVSGASQRPPASRLIVSVAASSSNGSCDRIIEALTRDVTWRVAVDVQLAGRQLGAIKRDVSPRSHELDATDIVTLPNALDFAGFSTVEIEIVDIHRHAAEKLHGMLKDFGECENSHVRDLADLMLILDASLLSVPVLADSVRAVWTEREATAPPTAFPDLPTSWPTRYERLAADNDIHPASFSAATTRAASLWHEMFATET